MHSLYRHYTKVLILRRVQQNVRPCKQHHSLLVRNRAKENDFVGYLQLGCQFYKLLIVLYIFWQPLIVATRNDQEIFRTRIVESSLRHLLLHFCILSKRLDCQIDVLLALVAIQ